MASQAQLQRLARAEIWDISTSHLTKDDSIVLQSDWLRLPRTVYHAHGYIVFVDSDPESMPAALAELRRRRLSESFIDLYQIAARDPKAIILINFDADGQVLPGVPTFEW